jgi:predicted GTPase
MGVFDFLSRKTIPIVIGINQVDNMGEWDPMIGLPKPETEKNIQERVKDIIKKLSAGASIIKPEQIEYYSALRAYRMHNVLAKLAQYSKEDAIIPNNPIEITNKEVSPDMPENVRRYIQEGIDKINAQFEKMNFDKMVHEMGKKLSAEERLTLESEWKKKKAESLKVGVIGKTGVGKTTTVNSLFQAKFVTSRTVVGTTKAQYKDFILPDGGKLTIVDMPGYGRSVAEDKEYRDIYLKELPKCDIILLVVQGNSSDLKDDQRMIKTIEAWSKAGLI